MMAGRSREGPLRATLPLESLLRHPPPPAPAPASTPGTSQSHRTIATPSPGPGPGPGYRSPLIPSPSPPSYKGRSRSRSTGMRRTASLDAIHQKSLWPGDNHCYYSLLLQVDKATQTDDANGKSSSSSFLATTPTPTSSSEDKLDRFLRHRLQRTTQSHCPSRSAIEHASQTMSPVFSIKSAGGVPLKAARSSVEGLNQEIERLVLCHTPPYHLDRYRDKATPEGHRAPVVEMLRRSVNTQTPAPTDSQSHSAQSSGPPSRESFSSGYSPERHLRPGGSVSSSPDFDSNRLGTSPHINKFLAREPPDGCEKVNLKFTECVAGGTKAPADICPIKPSVGFQLRPSLGSAFQPLQPPTPVDSPTSPVKMNLPSLTLGDD